MEIWEVNEQGALQRLAELEVTVWHVIEPAIAIIAMLVFGRMVLYISDALVAGLVLRMRGYKTHQMVRINGNLATITKIGMLSTHFEIQNGGPRQEYAAISNNRLDFTDMRLLVRRFDKEEG